MKPDLGEDDSGHDEKQDGDRELEDDEDRAEPALRPSPGGWLLRTSAGSKRGQDEGGIAARGQADQNGQAEKGGESQGISTNGWGRSIRTMDRKRGRPAWTRSRPRPRAKKLWMNDSPEELRDELRLDGAVDLADAHLQAPFGRAGGRAGS